MEQEQEQEAGSGVSKETLLALLRILGQIFDHLRQQVHDVKPEATFVWVP